MSAVASVTAIEKAKTAGLRPALKATGNGVGGMNVPSIPDVQ
jgi:hypothetical protein